MITNGIISKNIIASILLCLAFFILECNVKYSLIILALVGGMPLLVIIYLLFTGKYTELSEFGSMSYYGLGFIGNLMILAYSILIFKDKIDISIVITFNYHRGKWSNVAGSTTKNMEISQWR